MQGWDEETDTSDVDDELTALEALAALLEVEGDDELAWVQREALSAIAVEALALKERREVREQREAARLRAERARREAEEQAVRAARQAPPIRTRTDVTHRERDWHGGQRKEQRPVAPARVQTARPTPPPVPQPRPAGLSIEVAKESAGTAPVSVTDAEPQRNTPPAPVSPESTAILPQLTGADLASWRSRLGLTQQAAAERLGVRQGTISKAESGPEIVLGPALRQALLVALSAEPRRG
jgi:DNA-binding XRE family transcriptional regulator